MDEYHRACAELVENFQESPIPSNRNNVAWLACLTANPLVDYATAADMAKVDEEGEQDKLILGAALIRNGQHEEANRLLTELANHLGSDGNWESNYYAACAKYFLSNSRLSLGHRFQSQRLFDEAAQLADDYLARETSWFRRVVLETLRKEAAVAVAN